MEDNTLNTTSTPLLGATPEVVSPASLFTPQTLAIASLLVALVLASFYTFARKTNTSKGSAVLLVGPSDGGKSSILSALIFDQTLPSHASTQTNVSDYTLVTGKNQRIIDIPGHPRIRDQFSDHLPSAKAIVFVVDASTVSRAGATVAEHLHHVLHALTSLPPSQTAPALLIAAHKADLIKATTGGQSSSQLAINRVRSVLERELERRRVAQAGGVSVEGTGSEEALGGLDCAPGQPFRFADWEGGVVAFLGSWTTPGSQTAKAEEAGEKVPTDGLTDFRAWLEEL